MVSFQCERSLFQTSPPSFLRANYKLNYAKLLGLCRCLFSAPEWSWRGFSSSEVSVLKVTRKGIHDHIANHHEDTRGRSADGASVQVQFSELKVPHKEGHKASVFRKLGSTDPRRSVPLSGSETHLDGMVSRCFSFPCVFWCINIISMKASEKKKYMLNCSTHTHIHTCKTWEKTEQQTVPLVDGIMSILWYSYVVTKTHGVDATTIFLNSGSNDPLHASPTISNPSAACRIRAPFLDLHQCTLLVFQCIDLASQLFNGLWESWLLWHTFVKDQGGNIPWLKHGTTMRKARAMTGYMAEFRNGPWSRQRILSWTSCSWGMLMYDVCWYADFQAHPNYSIRLGFFQTSDPVTWGMLGRFLAVRLWKAMTRDEPQHFLQPRHCPAVIRFTTAVQSSFSLTHISSKKIQRLLAGHQKSAT